MPSSLALVCTFILQGAPEGGGGGGGWMNLIFMFGCMWLVVYFLLLRPQKKQQAEHRRMLDELKKNDRVQTSGGFLGKVVKVDADHDQVVLNVDESKNVKMTVVKSSIVAVIADENDKVTDKKIATAS